MADEMMARHLIEQYSRAREIYDHALQMRPYQIPVEWAYGAAKDRHINLAYEAQEPPLRANAVERIVDVAWSDFAPNASGNLLDCRYIFRPDLASQSS